MGTIIRTAAGIGCDRILLTKGCVNPWSSKVLRSSMGAHFNVKIHDNLDMSQIGYFLSKSSHMYV
jgi:tRNA G18 (ribose-2'-O)-methylase SpoU